ncbi:MAG: ferritin family protein [Nitrospirota bacterium]
MAGFSIIEVIEQAVQTEKLGADFYSDMAGKFEKKKEVKKLFETLAAKELVHELIFSRLKERIRDEGIEGWEEVSRYLRAIVESAFFLGKGKSLTSVKNIKSVMEAVDYALGFEKETLLYYAGIRDSVKGKKIIDEIIKEERSHIIWLSKFRKTLSKS